MAYRILVVDDEPRNMKLVRDLLQVKGYQTLEATDGDMACAVAREEKPDLILMDIQMPGTDGLSATRILKSDAQTSAIRVIALTSYAMTGDKEEAIAAGCDYYMTKPLDTREFMRKITEWLPL